MSRPVLLQNNFLGGVRRDFPRNQMPQGSLRNAVDYLLGNDAALNQRGGWANAASTSSVTAASTKIKAGIYSPFSGTAQNLCIDEDGTLFKFTGVSAVTSVTAAQVPVQNPVFHDNLVIIPSPEGTTSCSSTTGVHTPPWPQPRRLASTRPSTRTTRFLPPRPLPATASSSHQRVTLRAHGTPLPTSTSPPRSRVWLRSAT